MSLLPCLVWLCLRLAVSSVVWDPLQEEGSAAAIPHKVLGVFLTAAYMVVKGKIFVTALKLWRAAFYKLLQSTR